MRIHKAHTCYQQSVFTTVIDDRWGEADTPSKEIEGGESSVSLIAGTVSIQYHNANSGRIAWNT
jgi:hypothetical protein